MKKKTQFPQFLFTYYNPFDTNGTGLGKSFLNYVKDVNLASYTLFLPNHSGARANC